MKWILGVCVFVVAMSGMAWLYGFNYYSPGSSAEQSAKGEYERQRGKSEQDKNEQKQQNKEIIKEHKKDVEKAQEQQTPQKK